MPWNSTVRRRWAAAAFALLLALAGCGSLAETRAPGGRFSIAVIPDTQNMVDFKHQTAHGFPFDASEQFHGALRWVAGHTLPRGGGIAFVTSVGDNWQHPSIDMDPEHAARGFRAIANPIIGRELRPGPETRAIEMPTVKRGWEMIAATGIPFGVAPGNHDYDAMWSDSRWPPETDPEKLDWTPKTLGMLHVGGLENFLSVFGADTAFFAGKPWYVSSYHGGTSSAQQFSAGGYRFLHLALEMSPDDDVLEWARSVIAAHPGSPTIVTTHDFLDTHGERKPTSIIDLKAVDPTHNSAEDLWNEFLRRHDQIFLVLCGHQHAQSRRVDPNEFGHDVHQILADFQDRGQSSLDAGVPLRPGFGGKVPVPIGDGWFRLLNFDTTGDSVEVGVRTYSAHYGGHSTEVENYASWYRKYEDPELSDLEFMGEDEFMLELGDFRQRFGAPRAE
jgi:hypothetical protein